jgi:MFS family permease
VVAFFAVLGTATGVWLARIPAVKHHLHLSDGLLGITLLAAPAGLVLVVLLAGRIVDRIGSKIPVLAGSICVALLPIAFGLAPNMAALMAALFGFGLASGMLDVAMNAQAVYVERGYGRPLMTSFHACFSFGGLAGSLFGGLFAWAGLSPAVTFLAAGVPMAAVAFPAGRWLLADQAGQHAAAPAAPAAAAAPADGGEHAAGAAASRWTLPVLVLGLLALCSLLGEGSAEGWSAVYLQDNLDTSAAFAALGYAAFSIMMATGRLAGDRLALRFGPVTLVRGCGLVAATGLATALISGSPAGALAGFAVFGAGLSCTFPQLLSAAGNADPLRPATAIARVAALGYLGLLCGPVLIGGLASVTGLSLALGLPVILALCIAAGAGEVAPRRAVRSPGRAVRSPPRPR